jgi:hypothetical protein
VKLIFRSVFLATGSGPVGEPLPDGAIGSWSGGREGPTRKHEI